MNDVITAEPWERLRELAQRADTQALESYLDSLPPSEAIRALFRLDSDEQQRVLITLSPAEAADLVEEIPDEHASDIIEQLPASDAAAILSEMASDDQADVLAEMDEEDAEAILAEMAPAEAENARMLASYEPDVAGGLMATEFLKFSGEMLVRDVIERLSEFAEENDRYINQHLYVVRPGGSLAGVLSLRDLVLSPRLSTLTELMVPSLSVTPEAALDALEDFFEEHDFLGVPVVDDTNRLLGVVSRAAVAEAVAERADSDHLKSQGIIGGDEIRSMPLAVRSRRRLSWLSINIVLNVIAASVIALYEETLAAVIALAVFLPIVSDMSGCSGNQAVAVSMRELALGLVKPFEVALVWLKEVSVGLVNGAALGLLLGLVAWAWKGNPYLGLVVGGALAANTLIAVSLGGTVPLLLKRLGVDPAVASGPILTTVTDMCGFFLVLSLATIALPLLTGV